MACTRNHSADRLRLLDEQRLKNGLWSNFICASSPLALLFFRIINIADCHEHEHCQRPMIWKRRRSTPISLRLSLAQNYIYTNSTWPFFSTVAQSNFGLMVLSRLCAHTSQFTALVCFLSPLVLFAAYGHCFFLCLLYN